MTRGKKLPDDIVKEAIRLKMEEGASLREAAVRSKVKCHTSLQPYLKDIPKGVKKTPAVVEVPVSGAGQPGPAAPRANGTGTGLSDDTAKAYIHVTQEFAAALREFREERKRREDGSRGKEAPVVVAPFMGRRMTAEMIEAELERLKGKIEAEGAENRKAAEILVNRIIALETGVFYLMSKKRD